MLRLAVVALLVAPFFPSLAAATVYDPCASYGPDTASASFTTPAGTFYVEDRGEVQAQEDALGLSDGFWRGGLYVYEESNGVDGVQHGGWVGRWPLTDGPRDACWTDMSVTPDTLVYCDACESGA